MKKVTLALCLPKKLLEEVDRLVKAGFYESRSEAVRDAIQRLIRSEANTTSKTSNLKARGSTWIAATARLIDTAPV